MELQKFELNKNPNLPRLGKAAIDFAIHYNDNEKMWSLVDIILEEIGLGNETRAIGIEVVRTLVEGGDAANVALKAVRKGIEANGGDSVIARVLLTLLDAFEHGY